MARGMLIIPTTGEQVSETINRVESTLIDRLGGYTKNKGEGAWDDGERVIEEDNRVIFGSHPDRDTVKDTFELCAGIVKEELDEDAVMVEYTESEVEMI